jgi:hypothetical protein
MGDIIKKLEIKEKTHTKKWYKKIMKNRMTRIVILWNGMLPINLNMRSSCMTVSRFVYANLE